MARLLLLSFIWGWSFLFIKVAGEDLTPTAVAAGRVALGALVLHAVLRLGGTPFPLDRRSVTHFLVVGAAGSAVPFTLLAWASQHIDSGLMAVLNASTPLFTAALAVPLLGERLRPQVLGCLVLGLAGVAVAAGVGRDDLSGTDVLAALAPVGAGACYGLSFCWAARHLMGIPSVVAAAGQVTGATVLLAPAALVTSAAHGVVPGPRQVGALLVLGAVGTGLAYVLSFRVVADLGATVASLCTYIIPVVALGVGAAVLGERITLRTVGGGLVIVASVALVTRVRRGPRSPRPRGDEVPAVLPDVAPSAAEPPPPSPGRSRLRRGTALAATALVAVGAGACGSSGGDGSGACGPVRREPLDRRAVHVLPGAEEPVYQTDPPTSGPHLAAPITEDVRDEPLAPVVQVGLLEEGVVIVQHTGLDDEDRARVEELAGGGVVVAPAADLPDGAAVVATAWVTKQSCGAVDVDELQRFADDHLGRGPGAHG